MNDDLVQLQTDEQGNSASLQVVTGDSRSPKTWREIADATTAGCLTSPPYLNNFDYADATRLELYFWTSASTWKEMCTWVRAPMVTATTQQSSRESADRAMAALDRWPGVQSEAKQIAAQLATQRKARRRGKEYDQVLPTYLADIGAVLENVSRILAPGAPCVLLIGDSAPYGVHIDTPSLLAALGAGVGLRSENDVKLRSRGARWTTSGRHEVALSERMLILRRE